MRNSHIKDDLINIPVVVQSSLFSESEAPMPALPVGSYFNADYIDHLDRYDRVIVSMSGGKDSIAAFLKLMEMGVDVAKVEFWHNCVDGAPGSTVFADWPFIESYNEELAKAFGVPLYFSWLENGFRGEMLKTNAISAPIISQTPTGDITLARDAKRATLKTRRMFPQQSGSLATRWCSSYLKIDVANRALTNQDRFNNSKTLFITGERREESPGRSRYNQLQHHAVDRRDGKLGRSIDHWRPVLNFTEEQVWQIMERHGVLPNPAYRLGWSRSSCQICVFNSPKIWATMLEHFPDRVREIASYEIEFGKSIHRSQKNVLELAKESTPFIVNDEVALAQSTMTEYQLPIFATDDHPWKLPAGAFSREGCGSL